MYSLTSRDTFELPRSKLRGNARIDYTNMSCTELALVDEQGISINHSIASATASLLAKMLVTKDLRYHCAYVSLDAGKQFVYNSPRILRKHLKVTKGTVSPLDYEGDEEE